MRLGCLGIGALALGLTAFLPLHPATADFVRSSPQDNSSSAIPLDFSKNHWGYQPEQNEIRIETHVASGVPAAPALTPGIVELNVASSVGPSVALPAAAASTFTTAEVRPLVLRPASDSVPEPSFLAIAGVMTIGWLIYGRRRRVRNGPAQAS